MGIVAALLLTPVTGHALGQADIAVLDLAVDSNCNWIVTLKNVGTTELPVTAFDQYYGTSIQILKNGAPSSGWRFSSGLKTPGSVVQFTLSPNNAPAAVVSGTITLGAIFQPNGSYEDTNPANNTMSKVLACTPLPRPQPDLAITSLDFTPDCRPHIAVKNIGTAAVPDSTFRQVYLQRRLDAVPAGRLYLQGGCGAPQGTCEFIDGAEYVPQNAIQYDIGTSVWLDESNGTNNSATASLPQRCKPGADSLAPQILSVNLAPISLPVQGGEVTLSVKASDNVGVTQVLVGQIHGQQTTGTVPLASGSPMNGEWRLKWAIGANSGTVVQTYTINVQVRDAAGNATNAQPMQLTVAGRAAGPLVQSSHAAQPQGPQTPPGLQTRPAPAQTLRPGGTAPVVGPAPVPSDPGGPRAAAGTAATPGPAPMAPGTRVRKVDVIVRTGTPQDAPLAQTLQERLEQSSSGWAPAPRSIGVEVANGNVRLTGKVATAQERAAVEAVARGTRGVRSVTNAIATGP
jgi:hypothetical protein